MKTARWLSEGPRGIRKNAEAGGVWVANNHLSSALSFLRVWGLCAYAGEKLASWAATERQWAACAWPLASGKRHVSARKPAGGSKVLPAPLACRREFVPR